MSVLGQGGENSQQSQPGEPNLGSNMPGYPYVMNAQQGNPAPTPAPTPIQQAPFNPDPGGEVAPPTVYPSNVEAMQEPPVTGSYPGQQQGSDFDRIMELYGKPPASPANDALMEMYRNFPQRGEPTLGRKILSIASALGGDPSLADQTLYKPYYNQLQDYSQRLKPLEFAARNEDRTADNYRMMLLGMMQRATAEKRAGSYEDVNETRQAKMLAEIEQMKVNAARREKEYQLREWIAKHPDSKFFWDEQGNLHAVNPKTNKEETISGIEGLTEEDKQKFIQNRQIAVEEERGANAKERSEIGKWSIVVVDGKTYRLNSATGEMIKISDKAVETPSRVGAGGSKGKPMSWTQQIARIKANYVKIISDNPDFQSKFKADPVTGLPILRKNHGFSDSDKAWLSRRLFNDVFDETGTPTPPNLEEEGALPTAPPVAGRGTNYTPPKVGANPNVRGAGINQPAGTYWMLAPDGKTKGKVPASEVARLKGKGYTTTTPPPGQQ